MNEEKFTPRKRITGASKKTPVKESNVTLWYDEEINKKNKQTFDKYFVKEVLKQRYNCVVCNKEISIDASYSNNGNKLICAECASTNFNSTKKLNEWLGK